MRTTKRFTPTVLERFAREGRGKGTHENYLPWHRVSRGDPASSGRSHLVNWCGRLRELLSDGELGVELFAIMVPHLDDAREQFPLSYGDSRHELCDYDVAAPAGIFPGTCQLCKAIGIKHPVLRDRGNHCPWVPSTDLLLTLREPNKAPRLIAIAYKPRDPLGRKRTVQLLQLEREYWLRRGAAWLLITPALYLDSVRLTLVRTAAWALAEAASEAHRNVATQVVRGSISRSLTYVIDTISDALGERDLAQRALWQSVWLGELRVDLSRGWRPHIPLNTVSSSAFWDYNPIVSGRSSWR